jgi:hypothetical protein
VLGELPAAANTKFAIDVTEVCFHCLDRDVELLGDLPVGLARLSELSDGGLRGAEFVGFT